MSEALAADALYEEAVRLMLEEKNDLALVTMYAALFQEPKHVKALCGCGSVLIKLKDYPGAEEKFREALVVDSSSEMAHIGLGQALAAQGHCREALKVLAEVLRVDADNFAALFSSALCYADLREWDSAQTAIDLALEVLPAMPLAQMVHKCILAKDVRRYNA